MIITMYNPNSGLLGPVIGGEPEDIADWLTKPHIVGAIDIKTKMLDLATMQLIQRPVVGPTISELRERRNRLLDSHRWTIAPDSPLTPKCQAEWLVWLKKMHKVLVDQTDETLWPERPDYIYS